MVAFKSNHFNTHIIRTYFMGSAAHFMWAKKPKCQKRRTKKKWRRLIKKGARKTARMWEWWSKRERKNEKRKEERKREREREKDQKQVRRVEKVFNLRAILYAELLYGANFSAGFLKDMRFQLVLRDRNTVCQMQRSIWLVIYVVNGKIVQWN